MIVMDLEIPETCRECLCSCQVPNLPNSSDFDGYYQKILCRKDLKEHVPMDEGCPIQKTGRLINADTLKKEYKSGNWDLHKVLDGATTVVEATEK